jgi:predicted N-acyltransferase
LARFNSKRRNQIKRERRELQDAKIELLHLTGSDLTAQTADFLYDIYRNTVNKFFYGRLYLNRAFFEEACKTLSESLHVVAARDSTNGRLIAGAFNLLGKRALYGRYWGAIEERPFVHFNVCFYGGIEACIERGLELFEPGAGGEHKLARGFEPSITHSVHHLRDRRLDRAIRDYLERERKAIVENVEQARQESGFKTGT